MDPIAWTFLILALAVVAFVSGRIPLGVVAIGVSLALWATGILTLPEALAGFGDPTVLFIAALFVVSESLDQTGVTAWVGRRLVGRTGGGRARIIAVVGVLAAVLSAIISINGAVAALLPIVGVVAVRAGMVPSKLLLPLAYAASAGSLLMLTGTPVNIVVSDAAAAAGGRPFGFFEFALVGLPLVALSIAYLSTVGVRLMPDRLPDRLASAAPDASEHAQTLRESYRVSLDTGVLFSVEQGVVEVLIAPRSTLIGRRVFPGMTTRDEGLVILGIRRGDDDGTIPAVNAPREVELRPGDAVLVQGPWDALERYVASPDVIAVTSPRSMRRSVPLGRGARRALGILVVMVVLLATGVVPPAVAALLAACALVVLRVLTPTQVFRSISWTTVVLIAGMIPLSVAFISTGASAVIADALIGWVGDASPHLALLVLCTVTIVLGQFISNVATVLVVAPIAVSVAAGLEVSILPFMMALTVAGAAAFLTPVATPANLIVMQPGGYRFGDYWRPGLPLALIFLAVAVLYVPLIWPF